MQRTRDLSLKNCEHFPKLKSTLASLKQLQMLEYED